MVLIQGNKRSGDRSGALHRAPQIRLLVDVVVLIILLGRARKRELPPAGAFPNSVQHILVDTSIGEA